jgi:regulator of cell morphogenesis and NO signaling
MLGLARILAERAPPRLTKEGSLESLIGGTLARQHDWARSELRRLEAVAADVSAVDEGLPGVRAVLESFAALDTELRAHMTKEEAVVFPYIVALEAHLRIGRNLVRSPFGVLEQPLKAMFDEQCQTRSLLASMRRDSKGYVAPPGASNAVVTLYQGLAALEEGLEEHGRVETQVLFPSAIELELMARA